MLFTYIMYVTCTSRASNVYRSRVLHPTEVHVRNCLRLR